MIDLRHAKLLDDMSEHPFGFSYGGAFVGIKCYADVVLRLPAARELFNFVGKYEIEGQSTQDVIAELKQVIEESSDQARRQAERTQYYAQKNRELAQQHAHDRNVQSTGASSKAPPAAPGIRTSSNTAGQWARSGQWSWSDQDWSNWNWNWRQSSWQRWRW